MRGRHGARRREDSGSVAAFLVIATGISVLFIGVAVDLTGKLQAMQRAQDVARQAARSAAQAIDGPSAVRGLPTRVDNSRAVRAGQAHLDAAGLTGSVRVTADAVTVTSVTSYQPVILSLAGVGPQQVTGSSTARLTRAAGGLPR